MRQVGRRLGGKGQARARRANGALVATEGGGGCPQGPNAVTFEGLARDRVNRSRKSGPYTKPANSIGTIQRVFLGPGQTKRVMELTLIAGFGADLRVQWRTMIDPDAAMRLADLTRPYVSRRLAREMMDEIESGDDVEVTVATLLTATRWYCALDLPASRVELWSGAPLFERVAATRRSGELSPA